MSTPKVVEAFYERIWNAGDLGAMSDLLIEDFSFRGSLGIELQGQESLKDYVRSVRTALANYRCEILTCVAEGDHAFAKMRFSGVHVGPFRGYPATGKPIHWLGAALFRFDGQAIAELWVLGDLESLDSVLKDNQPIEGIEHVQLAMPVGGEDMARDFYSGLLGIPEVQKPRELAERGDVWFESNEVKVHLGVDPEFRPARKAHPGFLVRNLRKLVDSLREAGVQVSEEPLPGYYRVYAFDRFGNRLELMEPDS